MGIESSCDETAAAVAIDGEIASNIIASQEAHRDLGGVVPELASRAHQQMIVPVVEKALLQANVDRDDLTAIAFTQGPGLLGSLLVGTSFAKGLAMSLGIPLVPVHHMRAHILSHFIEDPIPSFPFLCLTVSGGHTQIVRVLGFDEMEVLGETLDDAVGEAFDKIAKILGLPYPGGPEIDKLAQGGDPNAFDFPSSEVPAFNFSFSGIKTAFLYFVRDQLQENPDFIKQNLEDLCASAQRCLIAMLMEKLIPASEETGIRQIAIAGGVAANSGLRSRIEQVGSERDWDIFVPKMEFCTDNAAMIAISGFYKLKEGLTGDLSTQAAARLPFES